MANVIGDTAPAPRRNKKKFTEPSPSPSHSPSIKTLLPRHNPDQQDSLIYVLSCGHHQSAVGSCLPLSLSLSQRPIPKKRMSRALIYKHGHFYLFLVYTGIHKDKVTYNIHIYIHAYIMVYVSYFEL